MDELQTGVQQPLTVLPQAPVLVQPGKAALTHTALARRVLVFFGSVPKVQQKFVLQVLESVLQQAR